MFAAVLLLSTTSGYGRVIAAFVVAMSASAVCIWTAALDGGRYARLCTHLTLGTSLTSLTLGAVEVGSEVRLLPETDSI